jgi:peptide/nickel transport system permease protein
MIRVWLRSRAFRKFRRDRMAMASSVVIALYLAIAAAVLLGVVTPEDTLAEVGPRTTPGFGMGQRPEKRFEDADFLLETVERALKRKNAETALAEIRFGRRRLADRTPEETRAAVEEARAVFDPLAESENLDEDPAALPALDDLEAKVAALFAPPSGWDAAVQGFLLSCGTDRQGRSIAARAFYAVKIAVQIGLVTALFSVLFGSVLGAAAAYFGGAVDHVVQWLYSTFSSVPNLVLLGVLVLAFQGGALERTLFPVYAAFCLTFWIGPCRVVRGEVLRLKELDYVQAATAIGQKKGRILVRHILPNTVHLMFINFSLLFISAIKTEVILTFLGLGVKNEPSWGIMISQSKQEVVNDFFWQIGAATALMFGLVLAFNIFTDALQDALDPKHIS